MTSSADEKLKTSLSQILPKEYHDYIPAIMLIVAGMENNMIKPGQELVLRDEHYIKALEMLAGKRIPSAEKVVSFGKDSQFGDVSIRDIAGRDVVGININFSLFPNENRNGLSNSLDELIASYKKELLEWFIFRHPNCEVLFDVNFEGVKFDFLGREKSKDQTIKRRVFHGYVVVPRITAATIFAYMRKLDVYAKTNRLDASEIESRLCLIAHAIGEDAIEAFQHKDFRGQLGWEEEDSSESDPPIIKHVIRFSDLLNNALKTKLPKRLRKNKINVALYNLLTNDLYLSEDHGVDVKSVLTRSWQV